MNVGETISLDSQSDLESASEQIGLATYVAAVAFNSAALPANMPAWLKAAIGEKATALRADPNNPFLMQSLSTRETSDKRQKEQDTATQTQLMLIAQEQEREREEWARTESTVAGVTMTGAEWAQFAERLRTDDELRRRVIAKFESRGMTEEEANAYYDRVAEMARIAGKPPSQRTEPEAEAFEHSKGDPTFKHDLKDARNVAEQFAPSASGAPGMSAPVTSQSATPPAQSVATVIGPAF